MIKALAQQGKIARSAAEGVACQNTLQLAIVATSNSVTNPHVSHISSPIAAIITLTNKVSSVVVPVVAISHAP